MRHFASYLSYLALFCVSLGIYAAHISSANAQVAGPQFFVTWNARSYTPSNYRGKIFPTNGSPITVSFELVSGGKLVDLSQETINWYVDGKFFEGGDGLQSINFNAVAPGGTDHNVSIQLPDHQGDFISHDVHIPVLSPKAVVEAPFPGKVFSVTDLLLVAKPYFFNITNPSSLVFSWRVNDENPTSADQPDVVNVKLKPGLPNDFFLNVGLSIKNPDNENEFADQNVTLNYGHF